MASALEGHVVAPGDTILKLPEEGLVKIGFGVVRCGEELQCSHSGRLQVDAGKLHLTTASKRYIPVTGDLVIGYVTGAFSEEFKVDVRGPTAAVLPVLAFEGATKRNRPRLVPGDAVYARVSEVSRDLEPELTCLSAAGKAAGMGLMKGGCIFETDTLHARKLLSQPPAAELAALGETFAFEVAVGANGRVQVHSQAPRVTAVVVRALLACARLSPADSRATVAALVAAADRPHA